jgi:hypothetical protein
MKDKNYAWQKKQNESWEGHAAFRKNLVTVSYLRKSKLWFNVTGRRVKELQAFLPCGFKLRVSPLAPL